MGYGQMKARERFALLLKTAACQSMPRFFCPGDPQSAGRRQHNHMAEAVELYTNEEGFDKEIAKQTQIPLIYTRILRNLAPQKGELLKKRTNSETQILYFLQKYLFAKTSN